MPVIVLNCLLKLESEEYPIFQDNHEHEAQLFYGH